jgi:putative alpha-1,2-mannosidase
MAINKGWFFGGKIIRGVFRCCVGGKVTGSPQVLPRLLIVTGGFLLFASVSVGQPGHQMDKGNQLSKLSVGPVQYVEPLSGTAPSTSAAALAHSEAGSERSGNTIPAVGLPFGMTQFTPQTTWSENKCVPPYLYKSTVFRGFRASHWLSGSCTQDYGSMAILPIVGSVKDSMNLQLDHHLEIATPYEYVITFPGKYKARMTGSLRSGIIEVTMLATDTLQLLCKTNSDFHQGRLQISGDRMSVYGFNPVHRIYQGWGQYAGFDGNFYLAVNKKPVAVYGYGGRQLATDPESDRSSNKADINDNDMNRDAGLVVLCYYLQQGDRILVKLGTSFTGTQAAKENLASEIPGWDYNGVRRAAINIWNQHLGKIRVSTNHAGGHALKNLRIFYTSLYHAYQQPRLFNDVSGTYPAFDGHSSGDENGNGSGGSQRSDSNNASKAPIKHLAEGNYYDDFSMWDIYRAQLPLMMLLEPKTVRDFVRSILLKSEAGGWTPVFPCWNSYTAAMIGDHSAAFVAAAYQMGIRDFDVQKLYGYLRKNAFDTTDSEAYLAGKGRRALKSYLTYGYVPLDDEVKDAFHKNEQVSRTLEYSYDDYALSILAKALADNSATGDVARGGCIDYAKDYQTLTKRAANYKNVLDLSVGMVRGRYQDGSWVKTFTPYSRASYITEGTPAQYSFYVPQDIEGLIRALGGKKQLEDHLDSLFMKGGYWHGNEPGHQIPFMYDYTDAPYKTQYRVSTVLHEAYGEGPGGVDGNDDAGQMSAWYVFAAMGFYPVDPVSGKFMLTSPLFDRIVMQLNAPDNHLTSHKMRSYRDSKVTARQLVIRVHRISAKKNNSGHAVNADSLYKNCIYVQRIALNGQPYSLRYFDKELFKTGGLMDIWLTDKWEDSSWSKY